MPRDVYQPRQSQGRQPERTTRRATGVMLRARDIESAFAAAQHAMALFDEDGHMVRANRLFQELLALDRNPGALTGDLRELAQLLRVRDTRGRRIPAARLPVARALRGDALIGVVGVDLHVQALDGRELDLHVTATPLSTRPGRITGCMVMAHDLTETQRTTAQLREVAALSHEAVVRAQQRDAVFAAIADGVLLYDSSRRLLQVNIAARTLLGIAAVGAASEDEMLAQVAEQLADYAQYDVAGRPLPHEAWPLERVLRGETVTGRETADAIRHLPDGREHVLNVSAAPILLDERLAGAVLLLQDVTERRRRERQAAEHASQIEGIFEAMTDGLALL